MWLAMFETRPFLLSRLFEIKTEWNKAIVAVNDAGAKVVGVIAKLDGKVLGYLQMSPNLFPNKICSV